MNSGIDAQLEMLKTDQSTRTKNQLSKLHNILLEYAKGSPSDWSQATIGKMSASKGGPAYITIRANDVYKELIEAHRQSNNATTKKPPSPTAKKYRHLSDLELLKQIDNIGLRTIFTQMLSEFRQTQAALKRCQALNSREIIIDNRQQTAVDSENILITATGSLLNSDEIAILKASVNQDTINSYGFGVSPSGAIHEITLDGELGVQLMPSGFIKVIRKIIDSCETEG